MNAQINQLVRSLLKKDSIDECSVQELQQYAERHPYFGAAQLLLAKKLQKENDAKYKEQLEKTFLFFHNPLWVEQLLDDTGNATLRKAENEATETIAEEVSVSVAEVVPDPVVEKEQMQTRPEVQPVTDDTLNVTHQKEPVPESINPAFQKEELLFEPFHTVDYFASQGIKFKEDEKPKDKFGIQLKSFTDWLRTMKKLPVTEIASKVQSGSEQKVEQMAESSIKQGDVLTETMAEVWEKQGNTQKAIEIYGKLSLLEPSKSTYFAAKIEELKKKI
jgi:hypothetical protein